MQLFLVRHGQALPKHVDPDEGLSKHGREEVSALAKHLVGEKIEQTFHSGRTRTKETAEILCKALKLASAKGKPGMGPDDPVNELVKDLERMNANTMLVGHMPFMNLLVRELIHDAPNEAFDLATASAILLEKSGTEWTFKGLRAAH